MSQSPLAAIAIMTLGHWEQVRVESSIKWGTLFPVSIWQWTLVSFDQDYDCFLILKQVFVIVTNMKVIMIL